MSEVQIIFHWNLDFPYSIIDGSLGDKSFYTLMSQYIHQLGSSTMNMPTDLWVPVSDNVKPMKSHQCVLGIYYHPCTQWHFSLEGFYKPIIIC